MSKTIWKVENDTNSNFSCSWRRLPWPIFSFCFHPKRGKNKQIQKLCFSPSFPPFHILLIFFSSDREWKRGLYFLNLEGMRNNPTRKAFGTNKWDKKNEERGINYHTRCDAERKLSWKENKSKKQSSLVSRVEAEIEVKPVASALLPLEAAQPRYRV